MIASMEKFTQPLVVRGHKRGREKLKSTKSTGNMEMWWVLCSLLVQESNLHLVRGAVPPGPLAPSGGRKGKQRGGQLAVEVSRCEQVCSCENRMCPHTAAPTSPA